MRPRTKNWTNAVPAGAGADADRGAAKTFVLLYTDGACVGNPGPGGWAFILHHPASGRRREASGSERDTTNNRMEILAVIRGLQAIKRPSQVQLHSDSEYVVNGITNWMARWKRFGWKKTVNAQSRIKNADLWKELDEAIRGHDIQASWVRGHNGHPENEQCDELAAAAARRASKMPAPAPGHASPHRDSSGPSMLDAAPRPGPVHE